MGREDKRLRVTEAVGGTFPSKIFLTSILKFKIKVDKLSCQITFDLNILNWKSSVVLLSLSH